MPLILYLAFEYFADCPILIAIEYGIYLGHIFYGNELILVLSNDTA